MIFLLQLLVGIWVSSIVFRAIAYGAKDSQFKTQFELRVGYLLTVNPAANGDLVETLGG